MTTRQREGVMSFAEILPGMVEAVHITKTYNALFFLSFSLPVACCLAG